MGKNFIILFDEKEGTTPIVRILDNFGTIDIVRQASTSGWEPFDAHCCGPISMRNYFRCLELIYGSQTPYMDKLNRIYTATARYPLRDFDKEKSVGLKTRFRLQGSNGRMHSLFETAFKHFSIGRFRTYGVVVFVAVRQDIFRWALSKYHGDGTGRPGHLQFKLADGRIDPSQIPKIHVDLDVFRRLLSSCEERITLKRQLVDRLNNSGVTAWPMLYESFCSDRRAFFAEVLSRLDLPSAEQNVAAGLEKGTKFQKVHSHNIRKFVINADDVLEEFGDRYVSW